MNEFLRKNMVGCLILEDKIYPLIEDEDELVSSLPNL